MEQKQTQKIMKQATYWMGVIAIGLALGVGIQFARAWSEPTQNPPNGNVAAPLNVGPNGQSKQGSLILNTDASLDPGLTVNGNAKIKEGTIKITVSSGDLGKGLQFRNNADSANLGGIGMRSTGDTATYFYMTSTPGGGNPATVQNGLFLMRNNGLVSIGTTTPTTRITDSSREKLLVNGAVNLDGFVIGTFNAAEYNTLNNLAGPWIACQSSGDYPGSCALRLGPGANSEDFFAFGYQKDGWAKVVAREFVPASDVRLKRDIFQVENALEKIESIRGVSFKFKDSDKTKLGVVAQEIEGTFPELVSEGPDGYKLVNYDGFTGVFIEAIKEQQKQIEDLQRQIDELKNR